MLIEQVEDARELMLLPPASNAPLSIDCTGRHFVEGTTSLELSPGDSLARVSYSWHWFNIELELSLIYGVGKHSLSLSLSVSLSPKPDTHTHTHTHARTHAHTRSANSCGTSMYTRVNMHRTLEHDFDCLLDLSCSTH